MIRVAILIALLPSLASISREVRVVGTSNAAIASVGEAIGAAIKA